MPEADRKQYISESTIHAFLLAKEKLIKKKLGVDFESLQNKLDANLKTICYSCADVSIGPNDPIVIRAIANAIRNNDIKTKVQLIVRTSPAEDETRFKAVRDEFPEIVPAPVESIAAQKSR